MDLTIEDTSHDSSPRYSVSPCALSEIDFSSQVKLDAMLFRLHNAGLYYFQDTPQDSSPRY